MAKKTKKPPAILLEFFSKAGASSFIKYCKSREIEVVQQPTYNLENCLWVVGYIDPKIKL